MSASRWIHLEDVDILRETEAAFLIRIDDEEYWIPKSQIADPENYCDGEEGVDMSITEWIAEQKEIA